MINQDHIRFIGIAYYVASFTTALSLWYSDSFHMIMFGWTIFLFNLYQIFSELHDNQMNNEN
jgi:hypothetical protein